MKDSSAAAANLLHRELDSDQKGTFVYQILQRVRPLEYPSSNSPHSSLGSAATTNGFHRGDLVSVDVVRRGRVDHYHNDVTYLRLSDGSGWIPDSMSLPSSGGTSSGVVLAKPVEVETGLWTLYVDNCPRGQSLRHHPLDSPDTIVRLGGSKGGGGVGGGASTRHPLLGCSSLDGDDDIHDAHDSNSDNLEDDDDGHPVFYETMVKVHCDRKVVSPTTFVTFYRVQSVNKWLMDRRVIRNPDAAAVVANAGPAVLFTQMLIDASHVRSGIFCFQAVENVLVRSRSSVDDNAGTSHKIKKGTLVSVDMIKESLDPLHGPYLRLSDGSGWLFVQKNGIPMMKQVSVQPGLWELRVLVSEGMTLQRHPMEATRKQQDRTTYPGHSFAKDSLVQATYRVRVLNPNHDSTFHEFHAEDEPHSFIYYRVHGTTGWLADRHSSGTRALKVLTEDVDTMGSVPDHVEGWTPEFVRGVASTIPTLREASSTPSACNPVLVFSTVPMRKSDDDDGIRRVVYCATRTVGILFDGNSSTGTNEASVEDRNDHAEGGDDGNNAEPVAPARWYRNCTPKELWEHLRKDAIEIMMEPLDADEEDGDDNESKRKAAERALENDEASNRAELDLRRQLLELDAKAEAAELKRREIVDKLRAYDEQRLHDAARMRCMMDERRRAYDTTLETNKEGAASSKLKDSKQLETREGGVGKEEDLEEQHPEVLDLASSASTTSSESTTESIYEGKKKQQNGHKCRSADAASPLPPALSTSPRSRRVEGAISVDRVSWRDQQGATKKKTNGNSHGGASNHSSKPQARRESSAERQGYRNRIEELLRMRSAETVGAGGSTLMNILSPEIDESIDEDSNTMVSDSGQSYDSESDDLSAEYDSY
jgi:hypothetical protein